MKVSLRLKEKMVSVSEARLGEETVSQDGMNQCETETEREDLEVEERLREEMVRSKKAGLFLVGSGPFFLPPPRSLLEFCRIFACFVDRKRRFGG